MQLFLNGILTLLVGKAVMKKIQLLIVCGLVLALGSVARAESNFVKPASVIVVSVQGEARYSVDGKQWHPLVVGKILRSGAVIETAADSSADLVLSGTPVPVSDRSSAPASLPGITTAADPNVRSYEAYKPMAEQNVIRMSGGTMLAIDRLTVIDTGADTVSDTELDLRAGKIFTNVKKMSSSSQFIIKLPNGVAGIRGSSGSISADGSAAWANGTLILSFIGANGQPHVVVVHGHFGYNPQTGEVYKLPPQAIRDLEAFGAYAQTLFAQVTVLAHDVTLIYISPTQGLAK